MSLFSVAGSSPSDGFELKSARFEDADTPYLTFTPTVSGNRETWTLSAWVKIGNIGTNKDIFSAGNGSGKEMSFGIGSGNQLHCYNYTSGDDFRVLTTRVLRDPSAWYHILCRSETSNSTSDDRVQLFINGERQTALATNTQPPLTFDSWWNYTGAHFISSYPLSRTNYMDGYLAEAYAIDGQALDPSYFGKTDVATGQWVPLDPTDIKGSVTFGTNGFYLPFSSDALALSFTDTSITTKALSPTPSPNENNRGGGQSYMYTQYPFVPTENLSDIDVLVVAGGAGGGGDDDGWGSGGGGGGGVSEYEGMAVTADTEYVVKVGVGGIGGGNATVPSGQWRASANGGSSSFGSIISNGGGYAGPSEGGDGGSGGGGSRGIGPKGEANQGNTGGATGYGFDSGTISGGGGGCGGGGAGAVGVGNSGTSGGAGGSGRANNWQTGSPITYAAGGGGGGSTGSAGNGGSGGGGNGAAGGPGSRSGGDASSWGSGGGGSGGSPNVGAYGGWGSAGIVVVRYQDSTPKATGGIITTYGSGASQYQVHTFYHYQSNLDEGGDARNERIKAVHAGANKQPIVGPPVGKSALQFVYSTPYIVIGDSTDWDLGTGDFTFELWANINAYQANEEDFLFTSSGSTLGFRWDNKTSLTMNLGSGSYTQAYHMLLHTWYHLAFVRTSGQLKFFVNGTQQGSDQASTDSIAVSSSLLIGGRTANSRYFTGYMDEIRLSNSARYTSDFTVATAPFTSDSNTKLLIHGDNTEKTTWTAPVGISSVDYLVVGGGGAGGCGDGGGGGAGGYRTGTSFPVTAGTTYDVVVGHGGGLTKDTMPATQLGIPGNDGGYSQFSTIISAGGGGGGGGSASSPMQLGGVRGRFGGSGGGGGGHAASPLNTGGLGNQPSSSPAQGNAGGTGVGGKGGGGGGSSAAGNNGNVSNGTGGAGTSNSISGSAVTYGVGGNGDNNSNPTTSGAANTGNGGNGTDGGSTTAGGGGNGIVIIDDGTTVTSFLGTTIKDSSSSAHGLTLSGNLWNKRPVFGKGFGTDNDNRIEIIDNRVKLGELTSSWTAETWWQTDSPHTSNQAIMAASSDNWWGVIYNYDHVNTRHRFGLWLGNGSSWNLTDSTGGQSHGISPNVWYHIALVWTGQYYILFVDGKEEISIETGTSYTGMVNTLNIGAWGNDSLKTKGAFDEFRISAADRTIQKFTPTANIDVNYLVIAGGGGGGVNGGGGAGGYRAGSSYSVSNGTAYDVIVGTGGHGCYTYNGLGGGEPQYLPQRGGISQFATITSSGGGSGGYNSSGTAFVGLSGGSGGGGSFNGGTKGFGNRGNYSTVEGYDGGDGDNGTGVTDRGGGGGGSSAVGVDGGPATGGTGGAGTASSITGTSVTRAGGGGAAANGQGGSGAGGSGGGGAGGANNTGNSGTGYGNGVDGTVNTGSGGGGGSWEKMTGGRGGSGIVIISYQANSVQATGGTITTYGSGGSQYYVHSFTEEFPIATSAYIDDIDTNVLLHMDGGGDLDPETGNPTAIADGTYWRSASVDAIYYAANGLPNPDNKSYLTFDGSGDNIAIETPGLDRFPSDLDFGTNIDFTVEFWMNCGKQTKSVACMLGSGNTGWGTGACLIRMSGSTGNYVEVFHYNGNGSTAMLSGVTKVNDRRWHHIAVVRSGAKWMLFVDGKSEDTWVGTNPSTDWGKNGVLFLGKNGWDGSNGEWAGKMDGVRISSVARYGTQTFTPTETLTCDALAVGGGGGGGGGNTSPSGGGGAGGFVQDTGVSATAIPHTIIVGYGGPGGRGHPAAIGANGGDSSALSLAVAIGGGGGGFGGTTGGQNGGSGGGGSLNQGAGTGSQPSGSGNPGGAGSPHPQQAGGGGGGAGGSGVAATSPLRGTGGAGGSGTGNVYATGGVTNYAAGGGGSGWGPAGVGGSSGLGGSGTTSASSPIGTDGYDNYLRASDGYPHTGSGGGGSGTDHTPGGNGAGGVVVIRYLSTTAKATGGTITTYGSGGSQYQVHTFTADNFDPPTEEFATDNDTQLLVNSTFTEGGFGADHSGNYNFWTPTGLTVADMMEDSPTNNFATFNPLWFRTGQLQTFREGNLEYTPTSSSQCPAIATIGGLTSGKWYFEFYIKSISSGSNVGIVQAVPEMTYIQSNTTIKSRIYQSSGNKEINGSTSSYAASYSSGDIIGTALDIDAGTITFYKLNTTQGVAFTDIVSAMPSDGWTFYVEQASTSNTALANFGQDSSFAGNLTAQGNQDQNDKGDFYYEPPAGFLALCTDNLPSPSITSPDENFKTLLWSGAQSGSSAPDRAMTGVGFSPDIVMSKSRVGANQGQFVYTGSTDSVQQALEMDAAAHPGQGHGSGYVDTIDSDGFTTAAGSSGVINWDESGRKYVAWCFKAGGAPTANNSAGAGNVPTAGSVKINGANSGASLAGSIAVTRLSANTTAGISISEWTGTGTAGSNVAHGLSQVPDMIVNKNRSASNTGGWYVYHKDMWETDPEDRAMQWNHTNPASDWSFAWNDTAPTASVWTNGGDTNSGGSGQTFVTMCFHSVEGYSKCGVYTGNNNANGPFVYTGFTPSWVLIKNTDLTDDWEIYDGSMNPYNYLDLGLKMNTTGAQYALNSNNRAFDFLSNGFKVRGTNAGINTNNDEMIYIAFAESPFKTSNAR